MIIWDGKGWLVLVLAIVSAIILMPFDDMLKSHVLDTGLFELALLLAMTALGSLGFGMVLEHFDRKQDPELTAKAAQKLHSFFALDLSQWGYICLGLSLICLGFSGVLDR
jgi:hypothetical protein